MKFVQLVDRMAFVGDAACPPSVGEAFSQRETGVASFVLAKR